MVKTTLDLSDHVVTNLGVEENAKANTQVTKGHRVDIIIHYKSDKRIEQ